MPLTAKQKAEFANWKRQHNLSNSDIAEIFGLKDDKAFNASSGRERYVAAILKIIAIEREAI